VARVRLLALLTTLCAVLAAGSTTTSAAPPGLRVVATHLDNPRKLAFGSDGSLYVAEGGTGGTHCLGKSPNLVCIGSTGAVTRITPDGKQHRVVTGLLSFGAPGGRRAEGPAQAIPTSGGFDVLLQDAYVDRNGANPFGPLGADAGSLVSTPAGRARPATIVSLAAFEAQHNPDHGVGTGARQGNPAIDSDPYAFTRWRGGYALVDAAGNDLLWLHANGQLSVLAVFPARRMALTPAVRKKLGLAAAQKTLVIQAVPSSVAVGPDGALYVGELTGLPFAPGTARIWRIEPSGKRTLYARGFTTISDLAFAGKSLLVLELSTGGILHPDAGGALIRLAPSKARAVVLLEPLHDPTGLAVGRGRIYIANYGSSPGHPGHGGQILSIPVPQP
jgi:hypothetical protein